MGKSEADLKKELLEKEAALDLAKTKQQDADNGNEGAKTYTEDEYKNAQAFGTKAQQDKIAFAEKLVKANPKELESMDTKLQNKVVESLYGAASLEELKIISPELFEKEQGSGNNEDDDKFAIQEKKLRIMEYRMNQGAVATAIENLQISNKDVADTIPEFEEKMQGEMKTFSSELSIKEKAEKAFKLVTAGAANNGEAYLALQGQSGIKNNASDKGADEDLSTSPLANAFKNRYKRG